MLCLFPFSSELIYQQVLSYDSNQDATPMEGNGDVTQSTSTSSISSSGKKNAIKALLHWAFSATYFTMALMHKLHNPLQHVHL